MPVCAKCSKSLEVEIEPDSDSDNESTSSPSNPTTFPDDVLLPCTCHFHWECLLDNYTLDTCPACNTTIVSTVAGSSSAAAGSQQIIVDLNNEGGLQEGIDILPILREESYLRAYPEERKCRAFLEFCREGDHRAIAELLRSCSAEDGEGEGKSAEEVLRYQDTLDGGDSGLHAAVANGHREVAWMLLLLASDLPEMEFPALVYQEAAALGVMRPDGGAGGQDIRGLRDSQDRTAEDIAKEVGVIWNGWIGNARLAMP